MLEGSITEGQSVRVQGGDASVVDKYTGDCFSDFRLMMKIHPVNLFSSVFKQGERSNVSPLQSQTKSESNLNNTTMNILDRFKSYPTRDTPKNTRKKSVIDACLKE